MIKHSIVLSSILPPINNDMDSLKWGLDLLADTNIKTIEYYTPLDTIRRWSEEAGARNLSSVFLLAALQKSSHSNLSSLDERERKKRCASRANTRIWPGKPGSIPC